MYVLNNWFCLSRRTEVTPHPTFFLALSPLPHPVFMRILFFCLYLFCLSLSVRSLSGSVSLSVSLIRESQSLHKQKNTLSIILRPKFQWTSDHLFQGHLRVKAVSSQTNNVIMLTKHLSTIRVLLFHPSYHLYRDNSERPFCSGNC